MMSYVCPNGHPVSLVETVACDAEGCMAYVSYEPMAHGVELHQRVEELEGVLRRIADGRYLDAGGRRRRFTSRALRDIAAEALP